MDHINRWKISKNLHNKLKQFDGKIVTRFPPEPSGYLHLGHAKALFINAVISRVYHGTLIFRLDDTNPNKESKEYEEAIHDDVFKLLAGLNIQPDRVSRTSDYFDEMIDYANILVNKGLAYVDDTDKETIKKQKMAKIESKNRNLDIETNKKLWQDMKEGSKVDSILRVKMDMVNDNGALRDPTLYRCVKNQKYKVYPTYDFACPVVDSIEGVTHVFRSTEFVDRDDQYRWLLKMLDLRIPNLDMYGKVNFEDSVMSKRKIRALIDSGDLEGWDDPRLLTIRGSTRRGLCLDAIIHFSATMGFGKADVNMTQQKLWTINKKIIDKTASRYTVLPTTNNIPVRINQPDNGGGINFVEFKEEKQWSKIRKYPNYGQRPIYYNSSIIISKDDVESFNDKEEITMMNWGNMIVKKGQDNCELVLHLDGDFKKTDKKVLWLCDREDKPHMPIVIKKYATINEPCIIKTFIGEPYMRKIRKGDYVQLLRMGYYICDKEYEGLDKPLVLIEIPC